VYLREHEYYNLVEALRRRLRFYSNPSGGKDITKQWTGLGSKTEYKQSLERGYMEVATELNPGNTTWWKLTDKGARVVCYWIGQGYTYEQIEQGGGLPPAKIPQEVF